MPLPLPSPLFWITLFELSPVYVKLSQSFEPGVRETLWNFDSGRVSCPVSLPQRESTVIGSNDARYPCPIVFVVCRPLVVATSFL